MAEYVKIHEKVTTWISHIVRIEGVESYKQAVDKVVNYCKETGEIPYNEGEMYVLDSEEMMECEESMLPSENGGCPTINVMMDDEIYWDNGEIC